MTYPLKTDIHWQTANTNESKVIKELFSLAETYRDDLPFAILRGNEMANRQTPKKSAKPKSSKKTVHGIITAKKAWVRSTDLQTHIQNSLEMNKELYKLLS